MNWFKKWRIALLKYELEEILAEEQYWAAEQRRLAREAHDVPDAMAEPMRWARLQNGSNWAAYYKRTCIKLSCQIERKIKALEESK